MSSTSRIGNRVRLAATIGIVAAVCGAIGWGARAQLGAANNGTPETITYRGYLEDSSSGTPTPVTGIRAMEFRIYTVASGGAPIWSCAGNTINVTGGNFEAVLGDTNCPFPSRLFNAPSLYLELVVAGIELTGRQRITSAPYAIAAAQANNFDVSGTLNVTGASTLNAVSAANVTMSGPAVMNGTVTMNAGATINGGDIVVAGAVSFPTPRPTFMQIHPAEFLSAGSTLNIIGTSSQIDAIDGTTAGGLWIAPIKLPLGTRITAVHVLTNDSNPAISMRVDKAIPDFAGAVASATHTSLGTLANAPTGGYGRWELNGLSEAFDASAYYTLMISYPSDFRIYGARVYYEVLRLTP